MTRTKQIKKNNNYDAVIKFIPQEWTDENGDEWIENGPGNWVKKIKLKPLHPDFYYHANNWKKIDFFKILNDNNIEAKISWKKSKLEKLFWDNYSPTMKH